MIRKILISLCFALMSSLAVVAQEYKDLEGRWNLNIEFMGKEMPSWLEIRHSGHKTLVGRFVFAFGSARPIAEVKYSGTTFSFEIPPQWEPGNRNMDFIIPMIGVKIGMVLLS